MAKLNNTDGFMLHGWMVNELGLKGGDLCTFALIHQFSQSNAGVYKGGVPYLAAWLGCVENTARRYLQDLVDRGLVLTERGTINGVPFCYYKVSPDTPQILQGDPSKIAGYTPQNLGDGTPQKLRGENNNRNIKGDNNTRAAFTKPTVDEVRQYCIQRGNDIDPEEFVAFYESKGWKVGNSPMKDWRSAIITWEKKRRNKPSPQPPSRPSQGLGDYYTNLIQEMRETYGATDADQQ